MTESQNNFYDHHDHKKWPVFPNHVSQEYWKQPSPKKAEEIAESYNMPLFPFHEFSPELQKAMKETSDLGSSQGLQSICDANREKIQELIELEVSIAELTTNCLWEVFQHSGTEEPYYSSDFRDHPDFEKHFAILEKHWGRLSSEHPQRKTLEIIRILKKEREKLKTIEDPDLFPEISLEAIWRRVNGSDIFMGGWTHLTEYYSYYKETLEHIAKQTSVFSLETYSDMPNTKVLSQMWNGDVKSKHTPFHLLIKDIIDNNPSVILNIVDPRDTTNIALDHRFDFSFPIPLDQELLLAYFNNLKEINPVVAEAINSPNELRNILHARAQANEGTFIYQDSIGNGKEAHTFFGEKLFSDAATALKLRNIVDLQKKEQLPTGPIFNLMGRSHIPQQQHFFDHPMHAIEVILQHPQYHIIPTLFPNALTEYNSPSEAQAVLQYIIEGDGEENIKEKAKEALRLLEIKEYDKHDQFVNIQPFPNYMRYARNTLRQKVLANAISTISLDKINIRNLNDHNPFRSYFMRVERGPNGEKMVNWFRDFGDN